MGRRIVSSAGAPAPTAEQGFTLIEVMIALAISIAVLFANIYLFNTAHKDLALARSVTSATNLATSRIADFRAMTIAQINAASPTVTGGPLAVRQGADVTTLDGVQFTRTWVVSAIDLQNATPPVADLVGDLVKIRVDVAWTQANRNHNVTLTTFTTGKAS